MWLAVVKRLRRRLEENPALALCEAALVDEGGARTKTHHLRLTLRRALIDRLWSARTRLEIFDPPRHRFVFDPRTLRGLVESAGFDVVVCRPQVSNLLHRLVAREVARSGTGDGQVVAAAGSTARPKRALVIAAALARRLAPGSAVRLFALKP